MFRLTIPDFIGGSVLLLLLAAGSIVGAQEAAKSAPRKLSSQEAIEQALDVKCSCDFDKTPLSEVVAFLARQRKINFIIDRRALDEIGIDPIETSVTLKVSDIPLRSLLSLALERHDLAWTLLIWSSRATVEAAVVATATISRPTASISIRCSKPSRRPFSPSHGKTMEATVRSMDLQIGRS